LKIKLLRVITLKVFGYTRISVDIEQDRDNTSIENQKRIIADYVAEHFRAADLELFADRDRSGYTFEQREEYQRMRKRLLDSETRILIVKDFSRFSRRNSLGLLELETLRDAGVRIISIGDGIDYPTKDDWMLIQFKFLMNEMPVTDTSKKIKAIINNRQKNGKWVCAVPYGYRMVNTKEMHYEIDPPAAEVVRMVFNLYNSGWGYKKIANHLTDMGVPTPRANEVAWHETMGRHTKISARSAWSIATVSGILSNDFYIGVLRQRKYARKRINGPDGKVEDQEQIVLENAHDPIIDTKSFLYAQEQLRLRSKNNYRGEKKYATDYSGYLFCGDCGAPMFSMSRPDLKPAYTCGTYHRRGRQGCTSHHIRTDLLDGLLKKYIAAVRDHSAQMLAQLETAIKEQPEREQEIGLTIERLEQQLVEAKEQLKALYKRKLIDTMGKSADEAEIVSEAYAELEKDLTARIKGLETQIEGGIDSRNQLLRANRAAKTVIDVFNDILNKPKLDKRDIGLLVEHIIVYENPEEKLGNRIDIQLKADIDGLLRSGTWENTANFPQGSEDISKETIVQSTTHRPDKVFTVNVISGGDPLEIYTDKEGGVIFKKYSLMGGLAEFSTQLCETLNRTCGHVCVITDRDSCIAVAGAPRKELMDKQISHELEQIMEGRQIYQHKEGEHVSLCAEGDKYLVLTAAPILSEGDVLGSVLLAGNGENAVVGEVEYKLVQAVAGFLGRHMES